MRVPKRVYNDYVNYRARLAQVEEKNSIFYGGMTHRDHRKFHRDQLPPEPHPLKDGWMNAATL
jgi:hypothetical protein